MGGARSYEPTAAARRSGPARHRTRRSFRAGWPAGLVRPEAAGAMEEFMPARSRSTPAEPAGDPAPQAATADGAPISESQAERAARSLAEGLQERRDEPFEIQLLESTLDFAAALEVVSAAFVPRFADWAFIHLVDNSGIARRVKVAHADPAKSELADEFRSLAPEPGKATITGQCIRDRSPRLVREVSEHVVRWAAHDHRHYLALKALAPRSILVLPLLARGRCIGGITLMRAEQTPGFTEADLVDAQTLTVASALALDNAERFARGVAPRTAPARPAGARQKRAPVRRKMASKRGGAPRPGAKTAPRRPRGRAARNR